MSYQKEFYDVENKQFAGKIKIITSVVKCMYNWKKLKEICKLNDVYKGM